MLIEHVFNLADECTCASISRQRRFCVLASHWIIRIIFQGLCEKSTVHIKQGYYKIFKIGKGVAWGDLLISLMANVVRRCIVNSTVDSSISLPFFCGPAAIRRMGGTYQFLTFLSSSCMALYLGSLALYASSITWLIHSALYWCFHALTMLPHSSYVNHILIYDLHAVSDCSLSLGASNGYLQSIWISESDGGLPKVKL